MQPVDPLPLPSKFEGANNPNHADNETEMALRFLALSDRFSSSKQIKPGQIKRSEHFSMTCHA